MTRLRHTVATEQSYENALRILESRRRVQRPITNAAAADPDKPAPSGTPGLKGTPSIVGMSEWLQILDYTPQDIEALNIIHIAGTKGKGSTCSFTESILRAHGIRTGFPKKTGLYTSPHLISPEERIRINGQPLSRPILSKYLFELYSLLPQLQQPYDPRRPAIERGPRYLQLWALLAFHVFIREGVDVAIIETHAGGQYDATNVITAPLVTAVTTLGIDHIDMLGPTLANIAWHKGGTYKPGAIALSTTQDPEAAEVLRQRAAAIGSRLQIISSLDSRLPAEAPELKPHVQRQNACLALAAAEAWLSRTAPSAQLTTSNIAQGISQWSWPGRFQIVHHGKHTWYFDAAHNDMSVKLAAEWFAELRNPNPFRGPKRKRILIFSHINELRDAKGVFSALLTALRDYEAGVTDVILTTYRATSVPNASKTEQAPPAGQLEDIQVLQDICKIILPHVQIHAGEDVSTIDGALQFARDLDEEETGIGVQCLITGSQHLVGPALQILQSGGLEVEIDSRNETTDQVSAAEAAR